MNNSDIPVAEMIESVLGCKWSLRVLELIRININRPGEMQRSTPGLSIKVLNERLNKLLRFGVITKKIYPEIPPHVEYSFTKFGNKFITILEQIEQLQKELGDERNTPKWKDV